MSGCLPISRRAVTLLALMMPLALQADPNKGQTGEAEPNPESSSPHRHSLMLVTQGEVDSATTERITQILQTVMGVDVVSGGSSAILEATPEAQATALSTLLGDTPVAGQKLLAILNLSQDVPFREGVFSSVNTGLLNIRMLRPEAEATTNNWMESYHRRIEKQALFVVGQLIGLPPCDFPICAMHDTPTVAAIDSKPRDVCPPCQMRLEQLQVAP